MQNARSGLAAAAAKLQLTDAPEGESSLQSRLNEAERRAEDAEASAQDARAALVRTLLEAAQVEAVVTARVKAQSEAELSALRSQLVAVKAAAPQRAGAGPGKESPRRAVVKPKPQAAASPADAAKEAAPNRPAQPAEDTADVPLPAFTITATPDERLLPPEVPDAAAIDAAESRQLRLMPPPRLAFLAVTAVVAVASYLVASSYMHDGSGRLSVAMNAVSGIAGFGDDDGRLVQGAATDPDAIADAAATLDAERLRLKSLWKKVAAIRTLVAKQNGDTPPATGLSGQDAGWLLYMPVERDAIVSYLAGRNWPGIQVASQGKTAASRKN
jgi:hypothetical protein